jgi:hypothetical protein
MIPFILKQHEKDRADLQELESSEIEQVSGGMVAVGSLRAIDYKLNTVTITRNQDGGDDGKDED